MKNIDENIDELMSIRYLKHMCIKYQLYEAAASLRDMQVKLGSRDSMVVKSLDELSPKQLEECIKIINVLSPLSTDIRRSEIREIKLRILFSKKI